MTCYFPIKAYQPYQANADGKKPIVFTLSPAQASAYVNVLLPCAKCIGCKLEYARQWAIRGVHESSLHEFNSFITLTYDDEHLPKDCSVSKRDFQLFMKKLRKKFSSGVSIPNSDNFFVQNKIRFIGCGEYGDHNDRPHYHLILFGVHFPDRKRFSKRGDHTLYVSDTLTSLWGKGHASIGDVSYDSIGYVARYVTKKITGDLADDHYTRIDRFSGEVYKLQPEFFLMSRKPGIAAGWFEKWSNDIYNKPIDRMAVHINGRSMNPPKYYDKQFEKVNPDRMADIKDFRKKDSEKESHIYENTNARLRVREICTKANQAFFTKREL